MTMHDPYIGLTPAARARCEVSDAKERARVEAEDAADEAGFALLTEILIDAYEEHPDAVAQEVRRVADDATARQKGGN
jgi:hypothetical protein